MNTREEIANICAYFFEVLTKQFLELEKAIHKQSGLLAIFKKINYSDRANAFKGLLERAVEARNALPLSEMTKNDYELYNLTAKLTECFAIYIDMFKTQIEINTNLNLKAKGENYNWDVYSKSLKNFDMFRNSLETELPKLQSLYGAVLDL